MEIKAKSTFDFDTTKAFCHVTFYGKGKPKNWFIGFNIFCTIFLLINVAIVILFGWEDFDFSSFIPIALLYALNFLLYSWLPKIQYKSLKKAQNMENSYIFCDDVIKISSNNELYQGEATLDYGFIVKVMETTKHFFIYQHQNQAYIVDKSTVTDGTVEELKEKLKQSIKGKYIVCKY